MEIKRNREQIIKKISEISGVSDRQQLIGMAIVSLTKMGLSVSESFDVMFYKGAYDVLCKEVYNSLKGELK